MLYGLITFGGVAFNPATDIPDLSRKVIFITGGNVGLGKETVLQLSKHKPAHIYLSARNSEKGLSAIKEIESTFTTTAPPPITFIKCDLASLPSVQTAAREFLSKESRLDILILNAGVMALPPGLTKEGYEIQFGTNHLGHALLTKLLLPTLLQTAQLPASDVRIISLSSAGHGGAPSSGITFDALKTPMDSLLTSTMLRYGQSKLANILFTKGLHKRYAENGILAVAVHPGVVNTDLHAQTTGWPIVGRVVGMVKNAFYTGVVEGAKNSLWAVTAERGEGRGLVRGGEYYAPVGVGGQESGLARDEGLADRLWEWTERELEGYEL